MFLSGQINRIMLMPTQTTVGRSVKSDGAIYLPLSLKLTAINWSNNRSSEALMMTDEGFSKYEKAT